MPKIAYIILSGYLLTNLYLFWWVRSVMPRRRNVRWLTAVVFFILFLSYWGTELCKHLIPPGAAGVFRWVGSWWIGLLFYSTIILFLIDLGRLAGRILHVFPSLSIPLPVRRAILAVVTGCVLILLLNGHLNARNLRVKTMNLRLGPSCGHMKRLNLVFLSDLHLGVMVNGSFLERTIKEVNNLKPDLVLLGGDTVDMDARELERLGCGEILARLRAPLGVYAVTGNHEFISGAEESVEYISRWGINFLRDRAAKINNSFYLAGREDMTSRREQAERMELRNILKEVNRDCPVILLDHQPARINEAVEEGVDLLLCGHTHNGQLFPFNLVMNTLYKVSNGYQRMGETQIYVTSGAGTWGPPVRIGNVPEIVQLKIEFSPTSATLQSTNF